MRTFTGPELHASVARLLVSTVRSRLCRVMSRACDKRVSWPHYGRYTEHGHLGQLRKPNPSLFVSFRCCGLFFSLSKPCPPEEAHDADADSPSFRTGRQRWTRASPKVAHAFREIHDEAANCGAAAAQGKTVELRS